MFYRYIQYYLFYKLFQSKIRYVIIQGKPLKRTFYLFLLALLPFLNIRGQETDRYKLIQVSGIITNDENTPVPHASIISTRIKRGTISEMTGIYSLISMPGDTVFVSALGYKKYIFSVPLVFNDKLYKKDIILVSDTISIEGVTILPWRNYEEFKRDVLSNIPVMKPEVRYMYENLASIQATLNNNPSYAVTPEAGYRLAMQQNANNIMTRNQTPVNNLLNPFAWAKFFNGVKSGLLKNQKTTRPVRQEKVKRKKSGQDK